MGLKNKLWPRHWDSIDENSEGATGVPSQGKVAREDLVQAHREHQGGLDAEPRGRRAGRARLEH